jgi:2-amino-4-hydroxy-6-hydroxymethyldihydropteridine diphosphokinase
MPRCLISLGANLGDPLASMQQALYWLKRSFGDDCVRASRFYRTPAIGGPENQQEFLNAVVAVQTTASPWDVWQVIREVEQQMGRRRNLRWEARAIDIDVLLFEDQRIWTPHFKIPHPRMCMRRFILEPALEVAADWIEPVSGWTISQLHRHIASETPSILLCGDFSQDLSQLVSQALRQLDLPESQGIDCNDPFGPKLQAGLPWMCSLPWPHAAPSLCIHALDAIKMKSQIPKLMIIAAAPPSDIDVAWEDWLRCWADALGMRSSSVSRLAWNGPRYLLPLQDRQWAVHELVAAIQAMQCPVEPLRDS